MHNYATLPFDDFPDLVAEMLYRACPTPEDTPFFTMHMGVAVAFGLTWIECLQYVLEVRSGVVH